MPCATPRAETPAPWTIWTWGWSLWSWWRRWWPVPLRWCSWWSRCILPIRTCVVCWYLLNEDYSGIVMKRLDSQPRDIMLHCSQGTEV